MNQLFDQDVVNPLAQAASNGNLNVQTLIEQSKSLGHSGKPVRPQSSRPMFRQNFMTLDPSAKRLGGGLYAAHGRGDSQIDSSKRFTSNNQLSKELNFQSGVNIHSIQEDCNGGMSQEEAKDQEPQQPGSEVQKKHLITTAINYESKVNLMENINNNNEPQSAMQRRQPIPGPSLMMKDRSDFIYHMLELETRGRISQKAVNQKRLSPRSSRLLASRHFMNRNSTAGSSGFGNNQKRGSEGSSLYP